VADDAIKAPGIAAMLRRHPNALRRVASGAIGTGMVLFVVASVANAGAGAARPEVAPPAPPTTTAPAPLYGLDTVPTMPVLAAVAPKPAAKPKPAPTDPAVISGLAANGIPTVALNAYRVAAARMDHVDPGCGIDWALLAGIGREESDHGQFAGAVLRADGVSTPRIIGIPLNGHGTALILDTDHGRLDGDTVYDRAVGPMQFIPSTWAIYGTDGNGDGIADPFNIYDAALTSARYLCNAGGDLRTHAGQLTAVYAYNHSDQYVAQVLALADAYRRGIPITGIPVGNISGALPPVDHTGAPPPANPGSPTANRPTANSKPAPKPAPSAKPTSGGSTVPSGSGSGSTSPSGGSTGSGSTSPSGGGSTTSGGSTSSTPTPTPTPTSTKCAVPDLLNPGHCAIK
jgi:hypothetical protein